MGFRTGLHNIFIPQTEMKNKKKFKAEQYFFRKGEKLDSDLPKTYLSKPTVISKGDSVWPEIAVLLEFKDKGYKGVWVDAFHKKFWINQKDKVELNELPSGIKEILEDGVKGCWDLILWKGRVVKFIELKGIPSNDKIRESQIKFRDNLLKKGFDYNDFSILEWDYK